jgi:hypothetical protein
VSDEWTDQFIDLSEFHSGSVRLRQYDDVRCLMAEGDSFFQFPLNEPRIDESEAVER